MGNQKNGWASKVIEYIKNEYWAIHKNFDAEGFSLHPRAILKRSLVISTFISALLDVITIISILAYSGVNALRELIFGVIVNTTFCWCLINAFVWSAHLLWVLAYFIGTKIGQSKFVWGIIEKRWGQRIDEITQEIMDNSKLKSFENHESLQKEVLDEIGEVNQTNAKKIKQQAETEGTDKEEIPDNAGGGGDADVDKNGNKIIS